MGKADEADNGLPDARYRSYRMVPDGRKLGTLHEKAELQQPSAHRRKVENKVQEIEDRSDDVILFAPEHHCHLPPLPLVTQPRY